MSIAQSEHAHWPAHLPPWLQVQIDQYLEQLRQLDSDAQFESEPMDLLGRAFVASEFLREEARRRPEEFAVLLCALDCMPQWQEFAEESAEEFSIRLRRFRRLSSVALILRDIAGVDSVADTLTGASRIAAICIDAALRHVEVQLQMRFGVPRSASGEAQRLVVIAMGKLGGAELNFSSDVDLILAFPESGESDGSRPLDNEEYFTRMGQRLAQMLGDVTQEGFVLRVDYRLRPYGSAGRIALSFNAMEHYYQREGREWERYAWIKARPVAGNLEAGTRLIELLRPFVYRRYLDFTAIEGLRDLKSRIDQEVDRQDLADNLKLGPGGIRELEFAVQLAQLIRGGREASLRVSGFLQAVDALEASGQFDAEMAGRTRVLYLFLRRVENRVQMYADEQTHALPPDAADATRIALALDFVDLAALRASIDAVRCEVQALFARTLDAPQRGGRLRPGETPEAPSTLDLPEFSIAVREAVAQLLSSLPVRRLDTRARERFERSLPLLMLAARQTAAPDVAALRLLRLLHAIAGRPSYLALLAERGAARERVAAVFARSAFLAERVIAHPLLLDDLLDSRVDAEVVQPEDIDRLFAHSLARVAPGDVEAELAALHEARQSAVFRTALAWSHRRLSASVTAARLAAIAEHCVRRVLALAQRDLQLQHGSFPEALLVLAYGSFGGAELGFGSDLDLVFLFDPDVTEQVSSGARALEGGRFVARLSQRVLHWLSTPTHAGPLYEVDVRLRPDGAKGLLVLPLNAFRDYQLQRAWVWEHQALVRARVVAGADALGAMFAQVRAEVLQVTRTVEEVQQHVGRMRARWRQELDRSDASIFDLKQGNGGLVDIEFLLQGLVLIHAASVPAMLELATTPRLIEITVECGLIDPLDAELLQHAHAFWLEQALDRALNAMPRVIARGAEVDALAVAVSAVVQRAGFADCLSVTS
ncbi:MAG: bifunctional [glutamate--ammonia ligase]-adenylyl-L-tyrosine phosphorylase/[glutamate--ammonia-ligase] adenylyltransferase [Pseudomonadota bacterium]|nr:bifunctional [glutamate--ammonia ligase]-adenylyl-L-tyrosine phosphorylase/[glutamate--ammonia-ligase] adenylyltransferase [Pseudomonadota bacterium]